jgi:NitT/TauT family transport system substrate-binding protein
LDRHWFRSPSFYLQTFGGGSGLEINFWRSVDEAISLIVGKKAQLSLLPVTIGAKLASSGIDIKLAAVSMWNGFYFITIEKAISSVEDLVGMEVFTLHAPGQTADIILKGAIEKSALKIGKDIKIAYVGGAEAVQLLASGKTRAILVPEPFATLAMTKVEKAVRSMPIEELWASFNEEKINIPTSGLFGSGDLDRSVVEAFLMLYGQSNELSLADRVENRFGRFGKDGRLSDPGTGEGDRYGRFQIRRFAGSEERSHDLSEKAL